MLVYDNNRFLNNKEGNYRLELHNPVLGITCALDYSPLVNPVRHGNNGVVLGTSGEEMFYYFISS